MRAHQSYRRRSFDLREIPESAVKWTGALSFSTSRIFGGCDSTWQTEDRHGTGYRGAFRLYERFGSEACHARDGCIVGAAAVSDCGRSCLDNAIPNISFDKRKQMAYIGS